MTAQTPHPTGVFTLYNGLTNTSHFELTVTPVEPHCFARRTRLKRGAPHVAAGADSHVTDF